LPLYLALIMPTKPSPDKPRIFVIEEAESGKRLDRVLATRLGLPRSRVRDLIESGAVEVDGRRVKAAARVQLGQVVRIREEEAGAIEQPRIPILYEDRSVVVVDKPPGIPVHPAGVGKRGVTVVGVLGAQGALAGGSPERPGVVHRLDALTSGVMVLARTERAWRDLVEQFRRREVRKEYLALVEGEVEPEAGEISGRLARDARRPWRMRVDRAGKEAETEFRVLVRREGKSLLLVVPRTGRTHQIRVHLAAIGHPVVGDPLYGGEGERLMLHAWRLGFRHPVTGKWLEFEAPPPPELASLLANTSSKTRTGSSPPLPPKTGPDPTG